MPDGVFLVRHGGPEYPEGFFVTTSWQGTIYHVKVFVANKLNFINSQYSFRSLYELVEHYTKYPMVAMDVSIQLRTPIPHAPLYFKEPWFHMKMTKAAAERVLAATDISGAFLVRFSESMANCLVLTFRYV